MSFRLIIETPDSNSNFDYVVEEKNINEPKAFYVTGPYMMAEGVNRNKRIYSLSEMVEEVRRYDAEMIKTGRAMGELNHPMTADVDLNRACHLVVGLRQEGNMFHGRSKILSTPSGLIVRSLIQDGVRVGMSTRGLGMLIPEGTDAHRVKNFRLAAIDCVADPSVPSAFVNGVLESKQFVLRADGSYEEIYDKFERSLKNLPRSDRDGYLRAQILDFIKSL